MAYRRKELEDAIDAGNSILLDGGRVITKKEDLPSEIELAGDDLLRRQAAVGDLEAQAKKIQDQINAAKKAEVENSIKEKVAKSDSDKSTP